MSVCRSVCLSLYVCLSLPFSLCSLYLSVSRPSLCISLCLSVSLSVCLSLSLSIILPHYHWLTVSYTLWYSIFSFSQSLIEIFLHAVYLLNKKRQVLVRCHSFIYAKSSWATPWFNNLIWLTKIMRFILHFQKETCNSERFEKLRSQQNHTSWLCMTLIDEIWYLLNRF